MFVIIVKFVIFYVKYQVYKIIFICFIISIAIFSDVFEGGDGGNVVIYENVRNTLYNSREYVGTI